MCVKQNQWLSEVLVLLLSVIRAALVSHSYVSMGELCCALCFLGQALECV